MSKHGKILVAMSGGIDSTVTALLLHDMGYEVIGVTMKTWEYASSGNSKKETGCCSLDSINDAREVAVKVGFHHFIVDIRGDFGEFVIDNFVSEYLSGRTPNPCVLCNTHIKWESLLKKADALDCEYIATGHYAKTNYKNDRYYISKAEDLDKDQSYVLWGLSQSCLSRSKFPLAPYLKSEVRNICFDYGFDDLSKKAESYEICFVPDNDYRGFLKNQRPDLENKVNNGRFLDIYGNEIGRHKGYPFYTVGQRKGLGQAFGKPMYVTKINPEDNTVVLGEATDLMRNGLKIKEFNFQKYTEINDPLDATVKIRYNDKGTMAQVSSLGNLLEVEFYANVRGVAPGQSAVVYEENDVIGGGIIASSL